MNFRIIHKAGQFLEENSSSILTAGAVIGTTMTAVLTAKASFKAADILSDDYHARAQAGVEKAQEEGFASVTERTTFEKVKLVWPQYIPPVIMGTATIGCVIAANVMSAKRAAALAAAYGISERNLREYKEKTLEKLGLNKERALRDEIAQDRVTTNPNREVLVIASGDVLCFDMHTGRYFRSTVERIRKAENTINQELFNHQYASLSQFYEEIGLAPTSFSDEVGWNMAQTGALEIRFSTTQTEDEQPCIAIDFTNPPKTDYTQLY